jgi:hypothetical protein
MRSGILTSVPGSAPACPALCAGCRNSTRSGVIPIRAHERVSPRAHARPAWLPVTSFPTFFFRSKQSTYWPLGSVSIRRRATLCLGDGEYTNRETRSQAGPRAPTRRPIAQTGRNSPALRHILPESAQDASPDARPIPQTSAIQATYKASKKPYGISLDARAPPTFPGS